MINNKLGNTNISVTPVGMGVLTIGRTQLDLSLKEGADIVRYALESGINFLDTAEYYETYDYIREALKGTDYKPVIASKSLESSYEGMLHAIQDCRKTLELDQIDIFLLHEVRYGDDRSGAWRCLLEAREKGWVNAIGVSTHYVDIAEEYAQIDECDIIFPLINYMSLGIRHEDGAGKKEDMARAIKLASDNGKGVFAMKAFGGGNLTGSYLEALDYVASLEGVDSIMVGIGNTDEIDRLIEYAEGTIDHNYRPNIEDKKIHIDQGDCEGCGQCLTVCPNKAISFNTSGLAEVDSGVCITCGYCAPACPVRAIIMY